MYRRRMRTCIVIALSIVSLLAFAACTSQNSEDSATVTPMDTTPATPSPTGSPPPQTVPAASKTPNPAFGRPLAWTFEAGVGLNTFVAVDGDTVVVSATDEYADIDGPSSGLVVALDLATGDELWRHELDAGTLIPGAGHGIAVVSDLDGVVHAWDIESGEALWTADTGAAVTQAVVAGELVVLAQAHLEGFGADGIDSRQQITGALLALDAATGEVAWTVERDTPAWESIAIRDDVIYSVLSTPGGGDAPVAAIDLNSGTGTWSSAIAGGFPGPPAVDDEHVYISAGSLFALDRIDGAAAWQFEPGGTTVWPTVAGDFVVVGGNVGSWFVVDAANGELRSEQEYCDCPWIAAGDRDVVYVSGPGFFAVRIELDGSVTPLWNWEPRQGNPGVPVLLDGRVVVGTRNAGQVAAFEP